MAKLNEGSVALIRVPKGKRDVQVFDEALPGFGVRKFASGKAFYFCKYTIGRKQRKMSLGPVVQGTLSAKRKLASEILSRARIGQDVAADREASRTATTRKEATLGKLVRTYLNDREGTLRPSTHSETTRYLERYWKKLHPLALDAISRPDIVSVIDEIALSNGKVAADRARAALSGFFSWAVDRSHLDLNPVQNIAARSQSAGRTRVLSEPELFEIWQACRPEDYGWIVQLLVLLGQRKSEIGSLERSEVDREKKQIELPGERTKNGRPHVVPLPNEALTVLNAVPLDVTRKHVFGVGEGGYSGWSKAKQELDVRIEVARREAGVIDDMPPWVLHDIRRSVVTHIHELGLAPPHVVEAIVNHVSGHRAGVAGVYNKAAYLPERRRALDLWCQHLTSLVAGRKSNVVSLRAGAVHGRG